MPKIIKKLSEVEIKAAQPKEKPINYMTKAV